MINLEEKLKSKVHTDSSQASKVRVELDNDNDDNDKWNNVLDKQVSYYYMDILMRLFSMN